eukprot:TRINITY_DN3156_c2_g1_i2.p1 TRINITY_DN3156_c2_g1~~TRINITY_DN3156_c2_g1_i2.p1  ORF type:complete len:228 (-),score=29.36 TRINITY_DN3156_c2_g1_i2:100-783(-)
MWKSHVHQYWTFDASTKEIEISEDCKAFETTGLDSAAGARFGAPPPKQWRGACIRYPAMDTPNATYSCTITVERFAFGSMIALVPMTRTGTIDLDEPIEIESPAWWNAGVAWLCTEEVWNNSQQCTYSSGVSWAEAVLRSFSLRAWMPNIASASPTAVTVTYSPATSEAYIESDGNRSPKETLPRLGTDKVYRWAVFFAGHPSRCTVSQGHIDFTPPTTITATTNNT